MGILFFPSPSPAYSGRGIINEDIRYYNVEINGLHSLYVTGELNYYTTEDKLLHATLYFYDIFDKVLARTYVKVTLIENDDEVPFEAPIHIDYKSDPLEVKGTHHIQWRIDKIEKVDCCTGHGGIVDCDEYSGKIKCYDGTTGSCICEEYNISY